mgnify:FL=1
MDKPVVTVAAAMRNQAPHLPTWLAHLEQQNFPAASFEIVLADLGSEDGSPDLAERHARGAPVRTRVVRLNGGSVAKGFNVALREASGKYVVFLSPFVLAGPNLLARYAATQQQAESPQCVLGAVQPHPQLAPGALTHWYLPEDRCHCVDGRPRSFLDWHANNLSAPRQVLLDAGAFDEGFDVSEFEGAELAWRLRGSGHLAGLCNEAVGYIWRGISFEEAYERQYTRGQCLWRLCQVTQAREIGRRFMVPPGRARMLANRFVIPFYERACRQAEPDTRLLGTVYRRTLRHARFRGFVDAEHGRVTLDIQT